MSCEVNQQGLRKFHGNWNIDKMEYYEVSGGSYTLVTTTNDAGYFQLYDQMYDDQENDCIYKFNTNLTSYFATALGTSGSCLWYCPAKNQIDFTGASATSVTVVKKNTNNMEWTYKSGNFKEVFTLKRIDI